jgi:hypothetical protein
MFQVLYSPGAGKALQKIPKGIANLSSIPLKIYPGSTIPNVI